MSSPPTYFKELNKPPFAGSLAWTLSLGYTGHIFYRHDPSSSIVREAVFAILLLFVELAIYVNQVRSQAKSIANAANRP